MQASGPDAGQAYTGNAIRTHLFNVAINDLGNVTNDLSVSREFGGDGRTLNLRMGYYSSRQTIDMDWTWNSYVQSLGRDSRLLNVVDAGGVSRSQMACMRTAPRSGAIAASPAATTCATTSTRRTSH